MNADGSIKLSPLIIGKYQKSWAFKNKTGLQLRFYYCANAKAWMIASIYQQWLLDWDQKLCIEGRKILLLQDNFSGHVVPDISKSMFLAHTVTVLQQSYSILQYITAP